MASKNKGKKSKNQTSTNKVKELDVVVKNEELEKENEIVEGSVDTTNLDEVKEEAPVSQESKKDSKTKTKTKKHSKLKKKLKETSSELKKVSWPTLSKTIKKTGVVLGFVALAALLLLGVDKLLSLIYSLLVK